MKCMGHRSLHKWKQSSFQLTYGAMRDSKKNDTLESDLALHLSLAYACTMILQVHGLRQVFSSVVEVNFQEKTRKKQRTSANK